VVAIDAALIAGDVLLGRWGERDAGVGIKTTDTDIVLDADRAAEDACVGIIRSAFPADAVQAEEGSSGSGTSGRTWYVDPLDGTVNYFYGVPHFACAIACEDAQGLLCGVVLDVWRQELYVAIRGEGAWSFDEHAMHEVGGLAALREEWSTDRGFRLRTTQVPDVAHALVATGFAYVPAAREEQARILNGVLGRVRDIRRFGSAQLDLSFVARGRVDAYFESVDKPWDWKAGALLVREAGGRVSELVQQRPGQPHIVASGAAIHDSLVTLLQRAVQSV
jgi:myo-inositol-1(or 4)-monophosphatase